MRTGSVYHCGTRPLLAGLALLMIAGGPLFAAERGPTLRDAWLAQPTLADAPGVAVMLRHSDRHEQQRQGVRLVAELASLSRLVRLSGQPELADGLAAWQERLEAYVAAPDAARTPGRADLAHWVAHPRQTPPLAKVASFGHCARPDWVEVWHPAGVARVAYRPGLTLTQALSEAGTQLAAPASADPLGDHAWLITPLGERRRYGIAAWNLQQTEVLPGSRLLVALNHDSTAAGWIDRALPPFLATRLPGEACQRVPVSSVQRTP